MHKDLTAKQRQALARLESEHGLYDYMCGGGNKPAVFVDFHTHSDDFRSYRIGRNGTTEDVTESMLLGA